MLIPSKYVLEEGKDAPEGTTEATCKFCKRTFAVPTDEIKNGQSLAQVCDDPACQEANDKEVAAQVQALMNMGQNNESQQIIDQAVGK